MYSRWILSISVAILLLTTLVLPNIEPLTAQTALTTIRATTTLAVSICGDSIVNAGEDCDIPGETGAYSTSIAGRQCNLQCTFGPYCGDAVLQTGFNEECDDGNNTSGDFCAADCTIEVSGSGGGGSGGGGSGSSGGSSEVLGDTQINMEGTAYPNETVHILLDAEEVGTVRADNDGEFEFAVEASPGTASLGFWSLDAFNTRSITFNTTFDVTQGAITNVRGIMLPPTIAVESAEIDPGDPIAFFGQTAPNKTVELSIDDSVVDTVISDSDGRWSIDFDSSTLSLAEHIAKARYRSGTGQLSSDSSYSSALTLFVGVEGRATTPSDLNRDGFINLIDFSILIFWWQTNGGDSDPPADINGNGNVGIEDFSILLFNWTG